MNIIKGVFTLFFIKEDVFGCLCLFTSISKLGVSLSLDAVMSQVEKKAGLLRRTSSSKKPLKEKVVLMYDEIFAVSITQEEGQ